MKVQNPLINQNRYFRQGVAVDVAKPPIVAKMKSASETPGQDNLPGRILSCFSAPDVAVDVAEPHDIPEQTSPTKSSRVPLARLKSLTIDTLYCNALEACQRHAATFWAENHTKPEFCTPLKGLTIGLLCFIARSGVVAVAEHAVYDQRQGAVAGHVAGCAEAVHGYVEGYHQGVVGLGKAEH